MHGRMKILLGVLGALLLTGAALALMMRSFLTPTRGMPIPAYTHPSRALLIVDIQEDYTGSEARKPYRDGARILGASNRLLAQAEAQGMPVAYVENVVENPVIRMLVGNVNAPGQPGTAMDRRLKRLAGAPTFTKNRPDAFSNPGLDAFLRERQVGEVIIVGLDAAYCLNATIHGALNRGYRVTVVPEGIATESRKPVASYLEQWRRAGVNVQVTLDL